MSPVPRKVTLAGENKSIAIDWSDGHHSLYPYDYLREKCPCATCTDAHGTGSRPTARPAASTGVLPMYAESLKPVKAEAIGRYALGVTWSDGHSTGIYSFDYLRELCPCGKCNQGIANRE